MNTDEAVGCAVLVEWIPPEPREEPPRLTLCGDDAPGRFPIILPNSAIDFIPKFPWVLHHVNGDVGAARDKAKAWAKENPGRRAVVMVCAAEFIGETTVREIKP